MSESNQPLLSIQDLSVTFGEGIDRFDAVKGLSLEVFPSEIVGLIGESGSGKTTSAHAVLGLIDSLPGIIAGAATLENSSLLPEARHYIRERNGKIIKRDAGYRKKQGRLMKQVLGREITAIFQEPKSALNPFRSIKYHLMESITRSRHKFPDTEKYGQDILTQVGIVDGEKVWHQYPHQLSGGMAQRVMIAMALACSPKLIVADEPTTALDVTTQAKLLDFFQRLKTDRGMSILLITHDIGVIHQIANRVYVMYKGQIVESGETDDIINRPQHEYTQKLLHSFDVIGERRIRYRHGRKPDEPKGKGQMSV